MPSRLRHQQAFEPFSTQTIRVSPPLSPIQKKQKMSLSQTYFIASSARAKLGREAGRPDHNLRVLVGHANLLDSLMLELRDAEREQEAWFNRTVQKAQKADEQPRHIQWADTIVEDDEDTDSDSESDCDDDDFEMLVPPRRIRVSTVDITSQEVAVEDEDDEDDDDDDMYEDLDNSPELALTRTESHPPELILDSDSEDESPPASPPQPTFDYAQVQAVNMNVYEQGKVDPSLYRDGFYIPERTTPLIEAF